MRKFLFAAATAAALSLPAVAPTEAEASWLSEVLHRYYDPYPYGGYYGRPYYGPAYDYYPDPYYSPAPAYGYYTFHRAYRDYDDYGYRPGYYRPYDFDRHARHEHHGRPEHEWHEHHR